MKRVLLASALISLSALSAANANDTNTQPATLLQPTTVGELEPIKVRNWNTGTTRSEKAAAIHSRLNSFGPPRGRAREIRN